MPQLDASLTLVCAKSQAAVGTAATINLASDPSLRVISCEVTPRGELQIQRTDLKSPRGPGLPPVIGSWAWTVEMQTETYLFSVSDAVTKCPLSPLLRGSAPTAVNTGGDDDTVEWNPRAAYQLGTATSTIVPFTMQIDEVGGNRYDMFDCVAILSEVVAANGGRVLCSWTVHGLTDSPAPVASVITQATGILTSEMPLVARNLTLTHAALASALTGVASITYRPNIELVEVPNTRRKYGFDPSFLKHNMPNMEIVVDAEDETTLAVWAAAIAGNSAALSVTMEDADEERSVTIALPDAYISLPEKGGDNFRQYTLTAHGIPDGTGRASGMVFLSPDPA